MTPMSTAIVVLLLIGFSLCAAAGLFTVLQSLIDRDPIDDPGRMHHEGPLFQDYRAER
jgi:hypothetical protein